MRNAVIQLFKPMKEKIFFPIILLVLFGLTDALAQSNSQSESFVTGKTSLFLELGGSGWLYSVNIDHRFHPYVSLRGGLSAVPTGDFSFVGGPVLINVLPGWNSHRFEIGAGTLLGYFSNNSNDPYLNDTIQPGDSDNVAFLALNTGYRYQPSNSNLFFRVAYTPFVTSEGWQHWGGIGIGFTLSN